MDLLGHLLEHITSNQASKFRVKNWVEVNNEINKLKTSMLKSNWCDYSGVYIRVKGTITVVGVRATAAGSQADRNDKQVIIKKCAPITKCTSQTDNKQLDNVKDLDVVMSMHNLAQYNDNYSKTSRSLYQLCGDELPLNDAAITKSE